MSQLIFFCLFLNFSAQIFSVRLAGFINKCLLLSFKKFSAVRGTIFIISIFTYQRVFQDLLHFKMTVLVQTMPSFEPKREEKATQLGLEKSSRKCHSTCFLFYDNCKQTLPPSDPTASRPQNKKTHRNQLVSALVKYTDSVMSTK